MYTNNYLNFTKVACILFITENEIKPMADGNFSEAY